MMDYSATISYLYSRLPMFSKVGSSAIKKDLTNTLELCNKLGNPHQKFKTIHVGGTNGKGSTSHMLGAILQTAGYKTGLYTSPHLRDFRERIRVNGQMIPEEKVIAFVEDQRQNIENISPSFFEVTVAMAFDHFAKEQVDIAVIEVGLGGRLDSTNVISPLVSVITNIGYDHVNILGDTLQKIAYEKAGIIKPKTPVVIGERQEDVVSVFTNKAKDTDSDLIFASDVWASVQTSRGNSDLLELSLSSDRPNRNLQLQLDLTGSYQAKNIKTVLSTIDVLRKMGLKIEDEHLIAALRRVKQLTGLMGRWQTLAHAPLIICDTGHNEDGIREVVKNIQNTKHQNLHMVIGMVKDKDITSVLKLLPKEATYYFCQPQLERAKPASELQLEAVAAGLSGTAYSTVTAALAAAKRTASADDLIFVGGSTFVVAEIV